MPITSDKRFCEFALIASSELTVSFGHSLTSISLGRCISRMDKILSVTAVEERRLSFVRGRFDGSCNLIKISVMKHWNDVTSYVIKTLSA